MTPIYISWQAITAVCSAIALSAAGVALYVRAALLDFLLKLDGRFVFCSICVQEHADLERRLDTCEHVLRIGV